MKELLYLSHNPFLSALPCTDYIYPIGIKYHRVIKTKPRRTQNPHIFFFPKLIVTKSLKNSFYISVFEISPGSVG